MWHHCDWWRKKRPENCEWEENSKKKRDHTHMRAEQLKVSWYTCFHINYGFNASVVCLEIYIETATAKIDWKTRQQKKKKKKTRNGAELENSYVTWRNCLQTLHMGFCVMNECLVALCASMLEYIYIINVFIGRMLSLMFTQPAHPK